MAGGHPRHACPASGRVRVRGKEGPAPSAGPASGSEFSWGGRRRGLPPPRGVKDGVDDGVRTRDPRDHNPMLCQLSYIHRRLLTRASCCVAHGAPGGNRTPDLRIRNPLLYPTELQAQRGNRLRPGSRDRAAGNDLLRRRAGRLRGPVQPPAAGRKLVGARGFEPPTPCSQSRCATGLRHAPMKLGGESGGNDRRALTGASNAGEGHLRALDNRRRSALSAGRAALPGRRAKPYTVRTRSPLTAPAHGAPFRRSHA